MEWEKYCGMVCVDEGEFDAELQLGSARRPKQSGVPVGLPGLAGATYSVDMP